MKIKLSKCDAMHIINWLNCFKSQCQDPRIGMHYLANDIDSVKARLCEECRQYFPDLKILPDGQVSFGTGNDLWWLDKKYLAK